MSIEPVATCRVQLSGQVGFAPLAALAPYLKDLGISHVYLSPILQAVPGSEHGYDVVDPTRVSAELGGDSGYETLCRALQALKMGQIIDVVPNHMATAYPYNRWWSEVLELGAESPHACVFDIDWEFSEPRLKKRILLPVLNKRYFQALEGGEVAIRRRGGAFEVACDDCRLPLAPHSVTRLLHAAAERANCLKLALFANAFEFLARRAKQVAPGDDQLVSKLCFLRDLVARCLEEEPRAADALDALITEINTDPAKLDAFLEEQHYCVAFWRRALSELNYRRFFAVNSLVGLRVEDERVFAETHALPLRLLSEQKVDGLRIDHIDGLRRPREYLERIARQAPQAWLLVEKILATGERIPKEWPVSGTTGYDFLNLVGGLFIEPEGAREIADFYREFTGDRAEFAEVARSKKRLILQELLAPDVSRLTERLLRICECRPEYRDFTRLELKEALCEVMVCLPVYRTYIEPSRKYVRPVDRAILESTISAAARARRDLDGGLFDLLKKLFLLEIDGTLEGDFVERFQQLPPAVMAKGIEDTAFYCYNPLLVLNEVGADPARCGVTLDEFHEAMIEAQKSSPLALLSTSTHDTKRSEDVRARLCVLSEIPERWRCAVTRWAELNRASWPGEPDRHAEYVFYQTMVGVWPIEPERIRAFMIKAVREARLHTSWENPCSSYESELTSFLSACLNNGSFIDSLQEFIALIQHPGRVNSLAQTLIKITAPGIPDFYQGTELWNFSLVDPDNRRPVDFKLRQRLLSELTTLSIDEINERADEGLPKLWLIKKGLGLRRSNPSWFAPSSTYRPIFAQGQFASHLVAFARGEHVVAVVPRLSLKLQGDWADTTIRLPGRRWCNVLTGEILDQEIVTPSQLFKRFPVSLLARL